MLSDKLRTLPQYLIPHHILSRIVYRIMRIRWPFFKDMLIRWFANQYDVDMSQAKNPDLLSYPSFNHFFTRELSPEARPITDASGAIVSPVDGRISAIGEIKSDTIFQAKGFYYSLNDLLGENAELTKQFENGHFINIYLSPRDYHRIHMPVSGKLQTMTYVPGRLFSVSPSAVRSVPRLFSRNERVVSIFDSELGKLALIKVGALFVSSIDTVWHGSVTPRTPKTIHHWQYQSEDQQTLRRGEEAARFNMGSTVILLFEPNKISWSNDLMPHQALQLGSQIGKAL